MDAIDRIRRAWAIEAALIERDGHGCKPLLDWIQNETDGRPHTIATPEGVLRMANRRVPGKKLVESFMRADQCMTR